MITDKNKFEKFVDWISNHPVGWKMRVMIIIMVGVFGAIKGVDELITIYKKYSYTSNSSGSTTRNEERPTHNPNIDTSLISFNPNRKEVKDDKKDGLPAPSNLLFEKDDKSIEVAASLEKQINNCLKSNNKSEINKMIKNNFSEDYICYVRTGSPVYEKQINFFRLIIKKTSIKIDSIKIDANNLIETIWLKTL